MVVDWVLLLADCVVLAVSLGLLAFALRLIFTYTGKTNDEEGEEKVSFVCIKGVAIVTLSPCAISGSGHLLVSSSCTMVE